jgi:hypothetical protein
VRRARVGSLELTAAVAAIAATVVVLLVATRSSGYSLNLWRAYILFLCFLALICALRALRHVGESGQGRGARRLRGTGRPRLPEELTRVNDLLLAGIASRPDFEHGMRPLLREIAADRLLSKGIDLGRDPEAAETELGPDTSALLLRSAESRPSFQDRGPSSAELSALLDRMESIGR